MEIFVCFVCFKATVQGEIRGAAQRLYQGVLYVRNVAKFSRCPSKCNYVYVRKKRHGVY